MARARLPVVALLGALACVVAPAAAGDADTAVKDSQEIKRLAAGTE